MGTHDDEGVQLEGVLFLGLLDDLQQECLDLGVIEEHFIAVDASDHVIDRSADKFSWLSHVER